MYELFIKQCQALKATMQLVAKSENDKLSMTNWVSEEPSEFRCGYVACVMGHHILVGDMTHFPKTSILKALHDDIYHSSSMLAAEFGQYSPYTNYNVSLVFNLAKSIYGPTKFRRRISAERSKLFTNEELFGMPHLCENKPTPQNVIDYIDIVIVKATKYYKNKETV
jgi:hypothetical protein